MTSNNEALLPFAGSDGWSGTETSQKAAESHLVTAADKQIATLNLLREKKARGVTVVDLRNTIIPHHGTASRVLSVLHVSGKILRLKESRDGAKVYVLPEYQMTRVVEPRLSNAAKHKRESLINARGALERLRNAQPPSPLFDYQLGWEAGVSAALGEVQELIDGAGI